MENQHSRAKCVHGLVHKGKESERKEERRVKVLKNNYALTDSWSPDPKLGIGWVSARVVGAAEGVGRGLAAVPVHAGPSGES
jgi:hypothetical protein